jgi:hypothetical protein
MPEENHPYLTMTIPDPVRGDQSAWEARYDGRKGYGVAVGTYRWDARRQGDTVTVYRVVGGKPIDTLVWGHDVFPSETMALLAAEFKNDLLVTLLVQRNQQHVARLIQLGYKGGDLLGTRPCDAPFFLEGICTNCGANTAQHAATKDVHA